MGEPHVEEMGAFSKFTNLCLVNLLFPQYPRRTSLLLFVPSACLGAGDQRTGDNASRATRTLRCHPRNPGLLQRSAHVQLLVENKPCRAARTAEPENRS